MSLYILVWGLFAARLFLASSCLLLTWRIVKGPKAQDRIIGLDTLYIVVMMLFATFAITTNSRLYFETAMIIAMIGFVSTIALAKFLMRGEVIE